MFSLYDQSAMTLKALYANYIQPNQPHQISGSGGMLDLNHAAYSLGAILIPDPDHPGRWLLKTSNGGGDAHSEGNRFDLIKVLTEMSPGSARGRSGQVYIPHTPSHQ